MLAKVAYLSSEAAEQVFGTSAETLSLAEGSASLWFSTFIAGLFFALFVIALLLRRQLLILKLSRHVGEQSKESEQSKPQNTQLANSTKLRAIGEMIGGIVHEVNNPLTVILAESEHLLEDLKENDLQNHSTEKSLKRIRATTLRISNSIRSLRSISRDIVEDSAQEASLKEILDTTSSLCRESIKDRGIRLEMECANTDIWVFCRPIEVAQVLFNLVKNSCDAIKNTIDPWIKVKSEELDSVVKIYVEDNGRNITSDKMNQLFDPSRSTKKPSETLEHSLNLSIRVLKQSGGSIEFDQTKENNCFIVTIPQAKKLELPDESRA